MFTGLIQTTGTIERIASTEDGRRLVLRCADPFEELRRGESIAVDGVCLTVVDGSEHGLAFAVVRECLSSALALHEELDATTDPMSLNDPNDRSDRVEVLRCWVVDVLSLGDRKEASVAVQGVLDGLHRARATR